jgi:hypothetical protein
MSFARFIPFRFSFRIIVHRTQTAATFQVAAEIPTASDESPTELTGEHETGNNATMSKVACSGWLNRADL